MCGIELLIISGSHVTHKIDLRNFKFYLEERHNIFHIIEKNIGQGEIQKQS